MKYKSDLIITTKIHPMFHVSCLKPFHEGEHLVESTLPMHFTELPQLHPLTVLYQNSYNNKQEVHVH